MKKKIVVVMSVMLLLACANDKTRKTEQVIYDNLPVDEQSEPDTIASSVQEEAPKVEEISSSPINPTSSSSSLSQKSSNYDDNMRGFDSASEDDMDDNGMSRYMENNDEKGWD